MIGRGFAKRIVRLTEASIDLSDGDLNLRIDDPSNDEIGQLGRQFNTMADQLSESLRSLRLLADKNAQLAEQASQPTVPAAGLPMMTFDRVAPSASSNRGS